MEQSLSRAQRVVLGVSSSTSFCAPMSTFAHSRRPEQAAFPAGVEIVASDLTVPESLDEVLDGVESVFLVWTLAVSAAAAAIARLANHTPGKSRRVVYLSAPYKTPHPFFQQANPLRDHHAEVERLLAATNLDVVVLRSGMFASNAPLVGAADPARRRGALAPWRRGHGAGR